MEQIYFLNVKVYAYIQLKACHLHKMVGLFCGLWFNFLMNIRSCLRYPFLLSSTLVSTSKYFNSCIWQELHNRRLQIKSKSKVKKKQKGFFSNKGLSSKDCADKDSNYLNSESDNNEKNSSQQRESVAAYVGTKQCQKLHWGYDMLTYYLVIVNCYIDIGIVSVICMHGS